MEHTPLLPASSARLDLDAVRCFVAVAESRAVQSAAARLGRTPSAVSMQLKKLEGMLSAALFERTRSGMMMTLSGERLLPHARRMLEAEQAAREAMARQSLSGRVRVGLIEDVGSFHLAETLTAFAISHPGVSVEMTMSSSRTLAPMLNEGALDLAILTHGGEIDARSDDVVLHEEPLLWAVSREVSLWETRPVPLAVYTPGCSWRRAVLNALDSAGISYRIAYQTDYYAGLVAVVNAGLAVAPLPRSQLGPGMRPVTAQEGAPPLGTARMALRYGAERNPAAEALGQRLREKFAC